MLQRCSYRLGVLWRKCFSSRSILRSDEYGTPEKQQVRAVVNVCMKGQLDEVISLLKWFPEHGFRTPVKVFGLVLELCKKDRSVEGLQAVLKLAEREGTLQRCHSLQNAVVSAMVATGQVEQARSCYERMEEGGVKLRQSSLSVLLNSAVQLRDHEFVKHILQSFAKHKGFPNNERLMHEVLKVCTPDNHVRDVAHVYRAVDREVDADFASAFSQWIRRHSSMQVHETEVKDDGICSGCGQTLERNVLTDQEHRRLLRFVEQMLGAEADTFVDNRKPLQERRKLKHLVENQGPFRAVMDGLNISRAQKKKVFCPQQLLAIARHVVVLIGPPVLVIAREHLAREFTASTIAACKEDNIHFFFTHNKCSDDYYFVYCSLASGKHSYFISDDRLGDLVNQLPPSTVELFDRWQKSCRVPVRKYEERNRINFPFQLPSGVSRVAQWSEGHIHLPLLGQGWLCVTAN